MVVSYWECFICEEIFVGKQNIGNDFLGFSQTITKLIIYLLSSRIFLGLGLGCFKIPINSNDGEIGLLKNKRN